MKQLLGIFSFISAVALIDYGIEHGMSESSPAPSLILCPTNGATVSGEITLEAIPMNFTSRITRVEFYRDGVLFKTVTNVAPETPERLSVSK